MRRSCDDAEDDEVVDAGDPDQHNRLSIRVAQPRTGLKHHDRIVLDWGMERHFPLFFCRGQQEGEEGL